MVYDPTRQWERYGALDPYYGVLSEPDFHHARLDASARERFFESGRRHVAESLAAIDSLVGADFECRAALDYGCGVGRLTLPLAEHYEQVYGVDVSPSMLREAERNAARMGLLNVEWVPTERLGELSGAYDFVQSYLVFQHIPVREGERIFAALVCGLRPGGVGSIHVALRPSHPATGAFHWTMKTIPFAYNLVNVARRRDWSYPHMQMNHYSLNRLGRLLARAGVTEWRTRFLAGLGRMSHDSAVIVFRKEP
jgi:cyclopropane fatty-acyl-phospholipid synthase-like methyltransferase